MLDLTERRPSSALWVFGYQGSLLHSDQGASELLAEGSLLHLDVSERLRSVDPSADRLLQGSLAPCRRGRAAKAGQLTFIVGEMEYRLMIYPLDDPDFRLPKRPVSATPERLAAVIRLDCHQGKQSPTHNVQMRFGLTTAEAAVALGFAGGRPLQDIARARGVAFVTARNQLQAVREKVGATNQADLMRRLTGFAALPGAED
jgi:DNA-binding CsgD family transcriptional regulator